ncbi:oxysterol-binding protein related protein OSH3 [Rhodotorula paludigena]|uniref:oxysterol-binding protein related protein OSH3 n=1 Tax=Rhodotorula paludigena TaxID=86838 RepID=UPI00317FED8A
MSSLSVPLRGRARSSTVASPSPAAPPAPFPPPASSNNNASLEPLAPLPQAQGGQMEMGSAGEVVMEGYLLKKKKKRMQGMARRYFSLAGNGALSYSFNPTSPVRDSIYVSLAYITASRKHRTLHIDGGTTVYHCKALTLDDFDRWAAALKRFISIAQADAQQQQALVDSPVPLDGGGFKGGNVLAHGGQGGQLGGKEEVEKVLEALARMNQPIADIDLLAQELARPEQAQQLSVSPTGMNGATAGSGGGGGSKFRFLGKRSNSTSSPHPPTSGLRSPSFSGASASPSGGTSSSATLAVPTSPSPEEQQRQNSTYFDANTSLGTSSPPHTFSSSATPNNELLQRQLLSAIATLKHTHSDLARAVHALPAALSASSPSGTERSASPSIGAYASRSPPTSLSSPGGSFYPSHGRASSRASFSSMWSDGGTEDWHDAIPGEYFDEDSQLTEEPGELSSSPESGRGAREGSSGSEVGRHRVAGEAGVGDTSTEASTFGEEDESEEEDVEGGEETDDEEDESAAPPARSAEGSALLQQGGTVQRRAQLPAPVSGDEFSMLGMLRKNVGKDLSTISFPININEPLSALQRLAEELEYSELLDRAAATRDPIERLTLVAVWAVSGTSGNKYRSSRKPFNPLLGETYECIRPEKGFQFISEKVSHHPPVLAFHGDAPQRGWQVFGHIAPSQKFWGRSMEVFVHGEYSVRFLDSGETYTIRKPSSFVRNLVAGTKYLEVVGDLVVTSSSSSAQALVSFKEGSTWGGASARNKIEGKVVDERGETRVELVGKWDEAVDKKEGKNNFTRLWQIGEFPPNSERYYGFSRFAVTLNETTPLEAGLVAPTDSRLRPDQLAFEHGDVDEAERLKALVEEKQRAKRKEGKAGEPLWFRKEGEEGWVYGGKYFEAREAKAFEDPDIFC